MFPCTLQFPPSTCTYVFMHAHAPLSPHVCSCAVHLSFFVVVILEIWPYVVQAGLQLTIEMGISLDF